MDFEDIARAWNGDGFVVVAGYLSREDLAPARRDLEAMYPTPAGFHDGLDPRRSRFLGDEFNGIDTFPFTSVEMSLLAVHERLVRLAERLLDETDLRMYSAEAWAKYTGAADYDQALHRDYLNHTLVVPAQDVRYQQVEMFVFLVDVPEDLGPPHMVPRPLTHELPAKPNWYPRQPVDDDEDGWVAVEPRPDLYDAEVSATGPAGTVVAFHPATFHRGTGLRAPRGARYSLHLNYRPACVEWGHRHSWVDRSHTAAWYEFVARATPGQLALFGFPPPGHAYWTPQTLHEVAQRYPGLDLSRWSH